MNKSDSFSSPDFNKISTEELQKSYQSGLTIEKILRNLAEEGQTVLDVILQDKPHRVWEHYPWQGGILDQENSSQYFYHSHQDYYDEHGHFHTFYYHQNQLVHLVAVGLDADGELLKLYTFNCWSPGDTYFPAHQLKTILPQFRIEQKQEFDVRIHAYIQNVLNLFRAEIEILFDQRDETFRQYRAKNKGQAPFEDRALEITSMLEVDLDLQIKKLQTELNHRNANLPTISAMFESPLVKSVEPLLEEGDLFSLEKRSLKQLQQSWSAGKKISETLEKFKAEGKTVIDVVMNEELFEVWKMYPWEGGVVDQKNKSQYFYHAHPQSPEHGHFHTFYHYRNELVHLVLIALDHTGEPIELMTVNRWVTGDLYVPAEKLKSFLPRFRMNNRNPNRQLHQFLRNFLLLYQPEIQALMDQREQTFRLYRQKHNGQSPFEDRSLEITSSLKVERLSHFSRLEKEIQRRKTAEIGPSPH